MMQAFYRESILWKNLVHDHVVPFLGVSEDVFIGTFCMVLPWVERGCLRDYLHRKRKEGELLVAAFAPAVEKWASSPHHLSYTITVRLT